MTTIYLSDGSTHDLPFGVSPTSETGLEILNDIESQIKLKVDAQNKLVSGPEDIPELYGPVGPFDAEAHLDAIKKVPDNLMAAGKATGEHLYENKFAYTLGALGMFIGPWTSAGASAFGTGLDTALKDENSDKIVRDVGVSLGIDVALLAALKIPPVVTQAIVKAVKGGADPKPIFEALVKDGVTDYGEKEAIRESQKLLVENGASLTLGQAGKKTSLAQFMESISFSGIFSAQVHKNNLNRIEEFAKRTTSNLFNSDKRKIGATALGKTILSNLTAARQAAMDVHGKSLEQISTMISKNTVDMKPLSNGLTKWKNQKKYKSEFTGKSRLDPKSEKIVNDFLEEYKEIDKSSPMAYVAFMKDLNAKISSLNAIGTDTFAPAAARELTDLASTMRKVSVKQIRKNNPKAAVMFNKAQADYGNTLNRLFPAINDKFFKDVGDPEKHKQTLYALGDMVTSMQNVEHVRALYKSLDKAFYATTKAERAGLKVKSPEGVKQLIRQRYLEKMMPKSKGMENIDFGEFKDMAFKLTDADESALAKEILGKDYNGFKAVVNAVAKSAEKPGSGYGSLALTAREISLPIAGAGMLSAGAFANLPALMVGGVAVLFSPVMMAKIITNPRRVNKFLDIQNKGLTSKKTIEKASVLINDIHKELSEDEKDKLAEYMTLGILE
jgi:hypothetical protein|tara:strand:+ start:1046 stop:3055 length:2010 start_codon:yes stop_codon:yes gene_type:complete